MELLAGLVLILCAWRPVFAAAGELNASQRGVLFVMHAWLLGVMIVSTFINLEFGILPDELTLSGIAIAVACSWVFPFPPGARILSQNPAWVSGLATSLSGAAVGGAIPLLLGVLARLQFGREAIGLGVVKYSAFLGSALGPVDVAFAFVLASLLGVGFGRLKMALRGRLGYVQFGPFQSIAAVPLIFWSPQVHHLIEGALGLLHHRR